MANKDVVASNSDILSSVFCKCAGFIILILAVWYLALRYAVSNDIKFDSIFMSIFIL